MGKLRKKIQRLGHILGPGFISGASDDDPTAIASYTQSGAQFGYGQLWTALFTLPFMIVIQEMCGRIGLVTGKGLSSLIRKHYSKPLLYSVVGLLLIVNTVNIGADLGAMAASAQLLLGLPFTAWLLIITAITLIMETFISYKTYARFLKYLTLTLLLYIATAFLIKHNWREVFFASFIPTLSLDKAYLLGLVALLGTNISPYLFFWQADEEVEEEVAEHKLRAMGWGIPRITKRDLRNLKIDTVMGMVFSNIIVFFICLTAAGTLGRYGITTVETPAEAALALRPLAGNLAYLLFAIGVIGSGLLTVPVLAGSASYAFAEAFHWKEGLYRKFNQAHGFYGVITIATLIGLLVNFTPIQPFRMLVYSAALNGILAPLLIIVLIFIGSNPKIMGKHTNSWVTNLAGVVIVVLLLIAAMALFWSFFN